MAMLNNRLNIGIPWIGSRDEPETTGFIPHLFHGKNPEFPVKMFPSANPMTGNMAGDFCRNEYLTGMEHPWGKNNW